MLSSLRVATLVLIACLVALFGYSWSRGATGDIDDRYREHLRGLQASNTSVDAALLRSRTGIENHYDSIVRHMKTRDEHRVGLEQYPAFLDDQSRAEIRIAVGELNKVVDEENELIESFKSTNAILRNSVRYLPSAAREVMSEQATRPDGGEVAAKLNALFTEVLLYHDFGGRDRVRRVQAHVRDLDTLQSSIVSEKHKRALVLLSKHVEKILETKAAIDELTRRISTLPTRENTSVVYATYDRHHAVVVATTTQLRLMLFLLSLTTVVCGAAFVIMRSQRSAQALKRTTVDLEKALASLEIEKAKQQELAELKSRFVSMTSHEFRTPLSVILSSTELLEAYGDRWDAEKKQGHLARIKGGAENMKQLLDGVLLIGKAEAGMLDFRPTSINVAKFCEDMVEGFTQDAHTEQSIVSEIDKELADCCVDERLLGHVLSNLLSNAIKYSASESTVRLDVRRDGNDLKLVVIDEGIGISRADRARLFEMFHRGSNVGTIKGTGLGLAIVHKSVEAHGGSIDLESELGQGSRFVVRLPIGRDDYEENSGNRGRHSDSFEHPRPTRR